MFGDDWGTSSDEIWGDIPRLLRRWRAPSLGASSFCKSLLLLSSFSFYFLVVANLFFFFFCCVYAVKKRPKLKSRYRRRVEAATEYAKTIDNLVDLRTLARHCLGLEPSPYVLHTIKIEEKSKCLICSSLTLIFFLLFCFFLFLFSFLQVFFFRRDDDEVQPGDVYQDEG